MRRPYGGRAFGSLKNDDDALVLLDYLVAIELVFFHDGVDKPSCIEHYYVGKVVYRHYFVGNDSVCSTVKLVNIIKMRQIL